jgi:CheY-like chemotaxis protein
MPGLPRRIVGFHQDDEGHWVADLECGDTQHMRHSPPWQVRPWVLTPEGRAGYLGVEIPCVNCSRRTRILIIDDSPAVLGLLQALFEENEFQVSTAPDGREALRSIAETRPDVVLTDVAMPHVDGFELLRLLRADPVTRPLPVIMLTADRRLEPPAHAPEPDAFVSKAAGPPQILETVASVLRGVPPT